MPKQQHFLEIACFSAQSATIASDAGASRIELCGGPPSSGGLTPSLADLQHIKSSTTIPVHVMIRPRAGDFVYTDAEIENMKTSMAELGPWAEGFVFGVLDAEGSVDLRRCGELLESAGSKRCIFHRAVDETSSYEDALAEIARLRFKGVLTSGRMGTAVEGAGEIGKAVERFGDSFQIIVGGGVRAASIGSLVARTGAAWYHSAALVGGGDVASSAEITNMLETIRCSST